MYLHKDRGEVCQVIATDDFFVVENVQDFHLTCESDKKKKNLCECV